MTLLPGCQWLTRWRPERDSSYYWQRPYPVTHWVPLPACEARESEATETEPGPPGDLRDAVYQLTSTGLKRLYGECMSD